MRDKNIEAVKFYNNYLSSTIKKYLNLYDIDVREAGAAICLTQASMYRRLRNPYDFKVSEIRTLCKKLHIPPEELLQGIIPKQGLH